jgi:hypothetical protein
MQEPDVTVENGAPTSPVTPVADAPLPPPPSEPSALPGARQSLDEVSKKAVENVLYSDVCGIYEILQECTAFARTAMHSTLDS